MSLEVVYLIYHQDLCLAGFCTEHLCDLTRKLIVIKLTLLETLAFLAC